MALDEIPFKLSDPSKVFFKIFPIKNSEFQTGNCDFKIKNFEVGFENSEISLKNPEFG